MRNWTVFGIGLCLFIGLCSCEPDKREDLMDAVETTTDTFEDVMATVEKFDSLRAAKLGADDYGMKPYVMALLYAGPNRETDSTKAAELQRAHLDNINRLAEEGTLVLAGPFYGNEKNPDLKGIYLFDVSSIEEAEALTKTDPAIQSGSLRMEMLHWYGTAALMEVNEIHGEIAKIEI